MWWYVKKKLYNDEVIKYEYGFETRELTGVICYNKEKDEFFIEKLAHNDDEHIVEKFLYRHLYSIIFDEDAPEERQIAIS